MQLRDLEIRVRSDRKVVLVLPNKGEVLGTMKYGDPEARQVRILLERLERADLAKGDTTLLGQALWNALLSDRTAEQFRQACIELRQDEGLRVQITFEGDARDLDCYRWPWEYLYHPNIGFLATNPRLALSRYLPPGSEGVRSTPPEGILRILGIVSKPTRDADGNKLGGVVDGKVVDTIRNLGALSPFVECVGVLDKPTRAAISKVVEDAKPHMVHFIGHGRFEGTDGKLALLRGDGETADWCTAVDFSPLFLMYPPLLVVLQACESGPPVAMGFVSVADQLVRQHNVPAVVAMQYEIANHVAIKFAEIFYTELSHGHPVDVAVQAARQEITVLERPKEGILGHDSRDFGVPVLFMRTAVTLGAKPPLPSPVGRFSIPYREYVAREYVGDREKDFEKDLEHRSIVGIWGESGIGKTWVGVRLATQWEKHGFSFSPYSGPPRQAFWFECKRDTSFQELVFAIAEHLKQQREESLWHWLQSDPNKVKPSRQIVSRLCTLLNEQQYLLCLDDFHYIHSDQDVYLLFEEVEKALSGDKTKIILIGREEPRIPKTGGHRLPAMSRPDIQRMIWALKVYHKGWMDEATADRIADRLIGLVKMNLKLMEVVAVNWLRSHTSLEEADAYLRSLGRVKIADLILEGGDDAQVALLTVLSILDGWEEYSTLVEIVQRCREELGREELAQAINALQQAKLVEEDRGKYCLHDSVRDSFQERQAERCEDLSGLHRSVAEAHENKGEILSAACHYLEAKDFSKATQLLVDNTIEVVQTGSAQKALELVNRLQRATLAKQDEIWIYVLLGDLHSWFEQKSATRDATQDGLELLSRLPEQSDPDLQYQEGRLRLRLGTALMDIGGFQFFDEAMDHLLKSEELLRNYYYEQIEMGHSRGSRAHEWLKVLNSLGNMYRNCADYLEGEARVTSLGQAIKYYKECISRSKLLSDEGRRDAWVARALIGLSKTYDDRGGEGDRERAITSAQDGLAKSQQVNQEWDVGLANHALGTIYLRWGQDQEALKYFQSALEAAQQCRNSEVIILSETEMAKISRHDDEATARDHLNKARVALGNEDTTEWSSYVLFVDRWIQGIESLKKGEIVEGCSALQSVLKDLHALGHKYRPEALLVESDLKKFGCSVPLEEIMPGEGDPAPARPPVIVAALSSVPGTPEVEVKPLQPQPAELEMHVKDLQIPEKVEPEAIVSPKDVQPALATMPVLPPSISAAATPELVNKIGRYEIQENLGSGAMGVVYKAYDPHTDRFVALKVLQPGIGSHVAEFEQRFRREARVAGRLKHPNIVGVYDADLASNRWYIAMEYLEGITLGELITLEGPQPLKRVNGIVLQVCGALNYAHECGVIHRDIKPSNIMILKGDLVKVADFGLASITSESSLTQSEAFLGTPRYMSPEQIQNPKQVDGRSDIFSLGAVVYELLTGKLLFPGERYTPISFIISSEPVNLDDMSAAFPDTIRHVLTVALAKNADERFPTCAEFSKAFAHAVEKD